jgi:hypothetical protein
MADREGGGSAPWVAFLAGIIIVALIGLGIAAYTGNLQPRETAQLELSMPDVKVTPPDIDLPAPPPAPTTPPSAEPAQAEPTTPP